MITLPDNGLYAITDCMRLDSLSVYEKTEKILSKGIALLQYRNKSKTGNSYIDTAKSIQSLCKKYSVPLIINDDVDLAIRIQAEGVHIGQNDMDCRKARIMLGPDKIVGVSCYNNLDTAMQAQAAGASYVAFGAFYFTNTKKDTVQADPDILLRAKKQLSLPVTAIGGITPDNGRTLVNLGADYLAVSNGLYQADDLDKALQKYLELFIN